jgi:hypothetical protein
MNTNKLHICNKFIKRTYLVFARLRDFDKMAPVAMEWRLIRLAFLRFDAYIQKNVYAAVELKEWDIYRKLTETTTFRRWIHA